MSSGSDSNAWTRHLKAVSEGCREDRNGVLDMKELHALLEALKKGPQTANRCVLGPKGDEMLPADSPLAFEP